ncbi:efflux RND transporter periplasmic adaptor subunit [Roseomonas sp. HJA6]|uniref:Efflux RND transporter periplasmic adaptor subunit n=1 Tax=Roseomonas alba TaxID=2846776 RepID=A0ABS7A3P1_9PROT|nr:efflux RND transporter periplasmic adaptor subunit [Neoroseomonas alba]
MKPHSVAYAVAVTACLFASGTAPAQTAAVPVEVAEVRLADVPVALEGIGTVQALNAVTLRAQVDGVLQEVRFREGQEVRAGDVLAQIDQGPYQAALDQAVARKAQDEAQLHNAELNLARYADLARDDFASRQQLANQQALVAQLQAQVRGDDAAIATARIQLGYATLTAPIGGVTGFRQVDAGNLIRAAEGTTIVVITQVQPIAVIFTLPAETLPEIRQAMAAGPLPVTVLERQGSRPLGEGTLLLVNNQIETASGQLQLKAELPNPDRALWPGQFVTVRLTLGTDRGVPTVPSTAIQRGPDGYWLYVVRPDRTVAAQSVQVRRMTGGIAVLEGGPPAGTSVVTAGQYRLQSGSRVMTTAGGRPTP